MARRARASQASDFISTITDTIASHPRLSAAVAFQMGVLLGQVMQNRQAIGALKRSVGSAPAVLASAASAIPGLGLFDSSSSAPRRTSRKTARRKRRKSA